MECLSHLGVQSTEQYHAHERVSVLFTITCREWIKPVHAQNVRVQTFNVQRTLMIFAYQLPPTSIFFLKWIKKRKKKKRGGFYLPSYVHTLHNYCFGISFVELPWFNCTGWLGMKHQRIYSFVVVVPLSGISGWSFDSPFLSPLFFFSLVLFLCHFSANSPFSWPFSRNFSNFFVRLFCMALVKQQGDDSW